MKYSDELDRISPTDGLSRRKFLTAGGHHAARLAAGVIVPGAGKRLLDASADAPASGDPEDQSDRRVG